MHANYTKIRIPYLQHVLKQFKLMVACCTIAGLRLGTQAGISNKQLALALDSQKPEGYAMVEMVMILIPSMC